MAFEPFVKCHDLVRGLDLLFLISHHNSTESDHPCIATNEQCEQKKDMNSMQQQQQQGRKEQPQPEIYFGHGAVYLNQKHVFNYFYVQLSCVAILYVWLSCVAILHVWLSCVAVLHV